jgi:hypothetical protein
MVGVVGSSPIAPTRFLQVLSSKLSPPLVHWAGSVPTSFFERYSYCGTPLIGLRQEVHPDRSKTHTPCHGTWIHSEAIKFGANMKTLLALGVCLLIVSGVGQAQPQMLDRDGRITISGVSVLPPQGADWQTVITTTYQLALQKRKSNSTYVAIVQLYKLPTFGSAEEFKKTISEGRQAEPDTGRFKMLKNDEELFLDRGAWCIKYHTVVEDRASRTPTGTSVLIRDERGYHCQHTANKNVGVWFAYSLRHMPDEQDPQLENKAREFLEQVKFTAF